jgi:TolB protein
VLREAGKETLRVHQVNTSSDLPVIPAAEAVCLGLTFSPDGDYIYYVSINERGASIALVESTVTGTLYRVPVLGGASQKLIDAVDSPVTFSPDGRRLAFVRNDEECEPAIMVANADGSGLHRLNQRSTGAYLGRGRYGGGPAWSPDGKVIACATGRLDDQKVVAVDAADGTVKPLGSQDFRGVGRLAWLPDGSGLVLIARDSRFFPQLFRLSYPSGEVSKFTNDLNSYSGVSLDANANSLVTVQIEPRTQHLWVMKPVDKSSDAKKIVSLSGTGEGCWTPDGRIVYVAITNDRWNLWVANNDGTEQKQLTSFTNQINVRPTVSPNGRHIVFVSDRAGPRNIWRVDIDGSNPVRLTNSDKDTWPTCSPDGRWVIYRSPVEGKPTLWKVPIDGGDRVPLGTTTFAFTAPTVSPDGTLIAYADRGEAVESPVQIVVIPFEGGEPVKKFDLPPTANLDIPVHWTLDGRSLTYVDSREGVSNVWSQSLEGGAPKRITSFTSDQIFTFDWSHDGKQLALWRGSPTRNVVLISNFR